MTTAATPASHPPRRANRLAAEKSPYLLQHQYNPVDWRPWGEEAFAEARAADKPIFLSIGYSTCHWCHVMERESFEDERVAALLNAHFISIKIDREERPDVDRIYMTFVQATSGQGGWPLNVFLAPDLKPFFGGTYFPPDNRHQRPGFSTLLRQIAQLWKDRRPEVVASAADIHARLSSFTAQPTTPEPCLEPHLLHSAAHVLKAEYDPRHGGFGGAPKFPRPCHPSFLLRYGTRFKDAAAIDMVLHTCERMAAGGMYDQLGGGFARYSVDAEWLVPHFEKMLYDNAQLLNLYLDAFLVSRRQRFADVALDIVRYILRDMTHPEGGFYSAEDADSEGKEGLFYSWTRAELATFLSAEQLAVVCRHFGVTEQGNFIDHSDPHPLPNQNVLSLADPNLTPAEAQHLEAARALMFEVRSRRIRPHLDDKILASWNGLMLGALARAHAVLGDPACGAAAERNLAFLQRRLWDPATRTLHHRWRDDERDAAQLLNAYAFLAAGTLDLYEVTLNPSHLQFSLELAEAMVARFADAAQGGFWQSAATDDLILRLKEDYDGAEPSGNSVAIHVLLRLAALTGRRGLREVAELGLRAFASRLSTAPHAAPAMLLALDYALHEPHRIVISGDPQTPETRALVHAAHAVYQPNKVVSGTQGAVDPFTSSLPSADGPTAYLCTGTACQPPVRSPAELRNAMASST
jgi:uncharacterized protein YyaL (SSP411 family)